MNDPGEMVTLLCTVRGCRRPLVRDESRWSCAAGHSFDIARSGYCNLLQPQDRRSANPGDSAEAVAARRRFLDRGHSNALIEATIAFSTNRIDGPVLDAGCGEGAHLAAFHQAAGAEAHGTDISVPAIDAAAKRHPYCHWTVANADRFLPYADSSFGLVSSITARLNSAEFRRVLRDDGRLLVVVAAPDDLLELREAMLGEKVQRDRIGRTAEIFAGHFVLSEQQRVQHRALLDREAISDVMTSSYRGLRTRERARLETIGAMEVTLARDLLLFTPR